MKIPLVDNTHIPDRAYSFIIWYFSFRDAVGDTSPPPLPPLPPLFLSFFKHAKDPEMCLCQMTFRDIGDQR